MARISSAQLTMHAAALVAIDATAAAQFVMLPFVARRHFGADAWQTMLITAAPPTLMIAAIFWNALLARIPLNRFLAVFAVVALVPTALIAFARDYWTLLGLHVLASIGAAGWTPVKGELLKRLYPGEVRGRALGTVNAVVLLFGVLMGLTLGAWLERDGAAFRYYLPLFLLAQLLGLVMVVWLFRRHTGFSEQQQASHLLAGQDRPMLAGLLRPLQNMRLRLREDRRFRLFEAAFMTYGAGWMICEALRPILLDGHLRLSYSEIALTTYVIFNLTVVTVSFPAGRVMDRLGPMRTSAVAFALLAMYPLALLISQGVWHIGVTMVLYGVAMAGVQQGWMLGPVSLAPRPELVAEYVAIHTTLVGLRGLLLQFVGMLLYQIGGGFGWALIPAAAFFAWGAWQMWALHQERDREFSSRKPDAEIAVDQSVISAFDQKRAGAPIPPS